MFSSIKTLMFGTPEMPPPRRVPQAHHPEESKGEFRAADGSLLEVSVVHHAPIPSEKPVFQGLAARAPLRRSGAVDVDAPEDEPVPLRCSTRCMNHLRQILFNWVGPVVKNVGGVVGGRYVGEKVKASLDRHARSDAEERLLFITLAVTNAAIMYHTIEALLTTTRINERGREEVVSRLPAACSGKYATPLSTLALTQFGTLFMGIHARIAGLSEANAAAAKMLFYVLARGQAERVGAYLTRRFDVLDDNLRSVPSGRYPQLHYSSIRRGLTALLAVADYFALLHCILNDPLHLGGIDDPKDDFNLQVGLYVGGSEWIIYYIDLVSIALALWLKSDYGLGLQPWQPRTGVENGPRPPMPGDFSLKEVHADGSLTPLESLNAAPQNEDVRAALATLRVDRESRAARVCGKLMEWAQVGNPHVYLRVSGFRLMPNLLVNCTTQDSVIQSMLNRGKFVPQIVHGLFLGPMEALGSVLEAGLVAITSRGVADQVLLDKLHYLFKLEDLLASHLGIDLPSRDVPLILREPNPALEELIEGMPGFADVREHFSRLAASLKKFGPVPFEGSEIGYPPQAMRDAFGGVTSSMEFLRGSRVHGDVLSIMREHLRGINIVINADTELQRAHGRLSDDLSGSELSGSERGSREASTVRSSPRSESQTSESEVRRRRRPEFLMGIV